jgi:DUF1009 family protein
VNAADQSTSAGPLGILCGGGSVPIAVADAVSRNGRDVVLFAVIGWADPAAVARYRHHWIHLGRMGEFFRLAATERCREVVFIGTVIRPSLAQIRLDWTTIKLFPRIVRAFRGGDNHLLSNVGGFLEDHGIRLLGAHEVAPEILMPEGVMSNHAPESRDRADIEQGFAALAAIGPFDVGQAVVVAEGHVLALEAAEGTDRMLMRVAELRRDGRIRLPTGVGVLIKAPKPTQDRRFDLPTIGPSTIEGVAKAGLAGIAVVAGEAIVAEPSRVAKAADDANIFVVGMRPGP